MRKFLIRRLLLMIPILFGISLLTFAIVHLVPANPITLSTAMNTKIDPSYIEKLEKFYGLKDPLYLQYWHWLTKMLSLDFGISFKDNRPVMDLILERLPATFYLSGLSIILLFLIAVPVGVAAAYYQNTVFDHFIAVATFIGYSAPAFWVSLLLMLFFGVECGWLPISGISGVGAEYLPWYSRLGDSLSHLILPLIVTTYGDLASVSRYARTSMLEVIRQDYIRTARAKGLPESQVIFKHALKNALIPVITLFGLAFPGFIGGSIVIETIFSWPGMGRFYYESIVSLNYPVIMGVGVLMGFMTLLGNFLADVAYAWLDPRIHYD